MKSLQNNNVKNMWPTVATLKEDDYLCSKISKKMNDEKSFTDDEEMMLRPYTIEEIDAMIDEAERESAAGLGQDSEDMFRELEEEFCRKDYDKPELASSYESKMVTAS